MVRPTHGSRGDQEATILTTCGRLVGPSPSLLSFLLSFPSFLSPVALQEPSTELEAGNTKERRPDSRDISEGVPNC